MKANRYSALLAFFMALACGCTPTDEHVDRGGIDAEREAPPHWSYGGETGPEHWADLTADWSIAREGREQSPIDVVGQVQATLPPIEFDYQPSRLNIVNNGHYDSSKL